MWEAKQWWCMRTDCGPVKPLRAAEAVMSRTRVAELSGGGLGNSERDPPYGFRDSRGEQGQTIKWTFLCKSHSSCPACALWLGGGHVHSYIQWRCEESKPEKGDRVSLKGTACAKAQRHELLGVGSGLGVR